ncbi:hypothetical protein GH741_01000 [Aquibacillus halophilus]|uniref:Asp/Glu/hydantoin racemase n=1 Tax=Aquibacillus halophilus TaxID=930132 RepID=A0A6A8DEA4_9BACI|nr:aspartate/glutamate racemase family protein [Aquibacillus halophilus]MRH41247.1 hypothetical protein [Aquibacillus halophilus]
MKSYLDFNALEMFENYMKMVGTPLLSDEETEEKRLYGKKIGLVNAASWIQLWCYYFGRLHLPGVKLINVGNEAVQLHFMKAFQQGEQCPPQRNIEIFSNYATEVAELNGGVDAIMVTCSTMNRSYPAVKKAVEPYGIPVITIDQPLMESAVRIGGKILIIATVQTTVDNTKKLLEETAMAFGKSESLEYSGAVVEEAFSLLGEGRITDHNELIANEIRKAQEKDAIDQVVLAQLSMSVFKLSYPNPESSFGIPVLTSGDEGFKKLKEILLEQ